MPVPALKHGAADSLPDDSGVARKPWPLLLPTICPLSLMPPGVPGSVTSVSVPAVSMKAAPSGRTESGTP